MINTMTTTATYTATEAIANETFHPTEQDNENETTFRVGQRACIDWLESQSSNNQSVESYCRGTFDGWLCWPDTAAGEIAYAPCPDFVTGFDITRSAHKECETNGEWFKHPQTGLSWSNYTTCVDLDELEWRRQINLIYETGYMISLIAIMFSLVLLSYFKSLKCPRITLHMNLFASFAAHNGVWLLWYRLVLNKPDVIQENEPGCAILNIILHYFLITNYAWMLCEGFYLHTVLVATFISESRLMRWLIWLGWSMSALVTLVYALLRRTLGEGNDIKECWINESEFTRIYEVPVIVSMIANLLFLFNIIRVVLLKLKAPAGPHSGGPSRNILQAFRATLLLVPLLGLQYILTPFKPDKSGQWERIYETLQAFTSSLQGLCVALLFCFFNGEVMAQVKRKWRTVFFRPRTNSYTTTQVSPVNLQFVRCAPPSPGEEKV